MPTCKTSTNLAYFNAELGKFREELAEHYNAQPDAAILHVQLKLNEAHARLAVVVSERALAAEEAEEEEH